MSPTAHLAEATLRGHVERVRRFNRFYTKKIGVLKESLLDSDFKLTEARVLFEIAHLGECTATALARDLGIDMGYLSRIIRRFRQHGLVQRGMSRTDGRQRLIWLTDIGNDALADLASRSRLLFEEMLAGLSPEQRDDLVIAMETIEKALNAPEAARPNKVVLRPHQPGDIGWAVYRQAVLYKQEYNWDQTFEAVVACILGEFEKNRDTDRERGWIAEADGRFAGCVFLAKDNDRVARLRCLLVEPFARGMGIGSRLVQESVEFARQCGYEKMTLWTMHVLHAARRIYERTGFRLTHEEPTKSFGHDLISQTWDLDL